MSHTYLELPSHLLRHSERGPCYGGAGLLSLLVVDPLDTSLPIFILIHFFTLSSLYPTRNMLFFALGCFSSFSSYLHLLKILLPPRILVWQVYMEHSPPLPLSTNSVIIFHFICKDSCSSVHIHIFMNHLNSSQCFSVCCYKTTSVRLWTPQHMEPYLRLALLQRLARSSSVCQMNLNQNNVLHMLYLNVQISS